MTTGEAQGRPGVLEVGVFLAEVAMLAALVYVGLALPSSVIGRIALVAGLLAIYIVIWGRWLAPKAPRRLGPRSGLSLKVTIFAVGSMLLLWVGPLWLAIAFFLVTEALVVAAESQRRPLR